MFITNMRWVCKGGNEENTSYTETKRKNKTGDDTAALFYSTELLHHIQTLLNPGKKRKKKRGEKKMRISVMVFKEAYSYLGFHLV